MTVRYRVNSEFDVLERSWRTPSHRAAKLGLDIALDVVMRTQRHQLIDGTVSGNEPALCHFRDICLKKAGLATRNRSEASRARM